MLVNMFHRLLSELRGTPAALAGVLAIIFLPAGAGAQMLRPVIVEYAASAQGRFEVVNDSLYPLVVTLEPKSFSVTKDGRPEFRPLDTGIDLKLSEMSFRIPPKASHFVFYKAKAERLPAWFTIYANFTGMPKHNGLNVQVELPHTVYILQKQKLVMADVRLEAEAASTAATDGTQAALSYELFNDSERFGRVMEVQVRCATGNRSFAGFPLMPTSVRRVQVGCTGAEVPRTVLIKFRNFTLKHDLVPSG